MKQAWILFLMFIRNYHAAPHYRHPALVAGPVIATHSPRNKCGVTGVVLRRVTGLALLLYFSMYPVAYAVSDIAPEPATGFHKKEVLHAKEYMVVAANPMASAAGAEMLSKGGSAVDAAIAVQMVLNVVEPQASGIGGGGFMLFYDKASKRIAAYDGREMAPDAATGDMFLNVEGKPMAYLDVLRGGLSVGTPGALRMLELAHKEQGKLSWATLFEPAIKVAEEGYPLSPRVRATIATTPYIAHSPEANALFFTKKGNIKPVGSIIKNPKLAHTFRLVAAKGADAFYTGAVAKSIEQAVKNSPIHPGRLTVEDLGAYHAVKRDALCDSYHGDTLCTMPPPTSGGLTILHTLKLLERFNLKTVEPNSPEAIHLVTEASRLAFADRNEYIADCDFIGVPVAGMLARDYITHRSSLIRPNKTMAEVKHGELVWDKRCGNIQMAMEHYSTTHVSIVDKPGNAVSMTTSIEYSFGSGLMVNGFFLNNQLTDFSFVPEIEGKPVANRVEPGKRPRSSMSPMLVFDANGQLKLVLGSPGGVRIIPYVLQTLLSVLDWGMQVDEAINQPHFANIGGGVELEKGTTITRLEGALRKLGHEAGVNDLNSGLHGIEITKDELVSGVDMRREGVAKGK